MLKTSLFIEKLSLLSKESLRWSLFWWNCYNSCLSMVQVINQVMMMHKFWARNVTEIAIRVCWTNPKQVWWQCFARTVPFELTWSVHESGPSAVVHPRDTWWISWRGPSSLFMVFQKLKLRTIKNLLNSLFYRKSFGINRFTKSIRWCTRQWHWL